MARLARVEKQTDLLERQGVLMLTKKAQSVEDLEELECSEAVSEDVDPVEAEHPSKWICQEGPSAGPSSSGGGLGEPASPAGTGSPVDYSRVPFWESSLDALFAEGVDPLALGDLGFEGGIL
ncbi:hypothetical protein VTN00DRAFT_8515 [Thermoascus crustaceus]|uniref:uncharacterized protein n=1 Tax=Thermoascus crustaceus TaxID=5088 RepID=UPI0037444DB3